MIRTLAHFLALAAFAQHASAQSTDRQENVTATLLSGWQTQQATHMAGLQLQLAPGWKTYWRAPGDAGIPPLFDWSASENVKSVRVHWPRPSVFTTNGMRSIGYHDGVTLPLEVTPVDPALPVQLRTTVELGVCRELCVPAVVTVGAELPAPGAKDPMIAAALEARAATAKEAGLVSVRCSVTPIADGLRVTAEIDLPSQGATETVVFEAGQPGIWVAEAVSQRTGSVLSATTDLVPPSGTPFALDRSQLRLTVLAGDNAVDIRGCPGS